MKAFSITTESQRQPDYSIIGRRKFEFVPIKGKASPREINVKQQKLILSTFKVFLFPNKPKIEQILTKLGTKIHGVFFLKAVFLSMGNKN